MIASAITTTGTVHGDACIVHGVYVESGASAGVLTLKDGGTGGTSKIVINTPAAAGMVYVPIDGGIEFATDVHGTLTNVGSVTVLFK